MSETYCQMIGFISGQVTALLTCGSDSRGVPRENNDVFFENLFTTQSNKIAFWLSELGHCV
jgi:hypothetical protein